MFHHCMLRAAIVDFRPAPPEYLRREEFNPEDHNLSPSILPDIHWLLAVSELTDKGINWPDCVKSNLAHHCQDFIVTDPS